MTGTWRLVNSLVERVVPGIQPYHRYVCCPGTPYYDPSTCMTRPRIFDESYRELREPEISRIATEVRRRELAAQDPEVGIRRVPDLERQS